MPEETEHVQFVQMRSELLSKFHGRPVDLRAGVVLPRSFDPDGERRCPLRVRIGGYGTRHTVVRDDMGAASQFRKAWLADDAPRMVLLQLDGDGPYGDPYQINSDNNGPYGNALTKELIPYVEKRFHCVGEPYARVLDGHSTGAWVALAVQVFYPDFFNGSWSHAPDPVDFKAYELINIYEDANAYVNKYGFERPASRDVDGETRTTVRHECRLESALGMGGRWELSGRDWCAGTPCSGRAATTACPGRCGTARRARSTRTCWTIGRSTICAGGWSRTGRRWGRSCAASCTSGSARPTIISQQRGPLAGRFPIGDEAGLRGFDYLRDG